MLIKTKNYILLTIGWISLIIGIIAFFVPLLPTTPFVLLTAYCFSKGSRKLHIWLLRKRYLGPMIRQWDQYGIIKLQAKIAATGFMLTLFATSLYVNRVIVEVKIGVAIIGVLVLLYIWTRPSKRKLS